MSVRLKPRVPFDDLVDKFQIVIDRPGHATFRAESNPGVAHLIVDDVTVDLVPGPEDANWCADMLQSTAEALAWTADNVGLDDISIERHIESIRAGIVVLVDCATKLRALLEAAHAEEHGDVGKEVIEQFAAIGMPSVELFPGCSLIQMEVNGDRSDPAKG